jgi:hypothetical protein
LCQSDKQSLIRVLSVLRYQLKNHILELLTDNHLIRNYIQNVIHEWNVDISPVDLFKDGLDQSGYNEGDDLFNYDTYIEEKKCVQEGGNRLKLLEQGLKERQSSFTPMTREYTDLIQGKVKGLHTECRGCIDRMKQCTSDTMSKCKLMDPAHKDILIDLSCKSKSIYLEYSNRLSENESMSLATFLHDKNDLEVPDTIHTIFLNYIITLNMLKKELNFISHSFKGLLTTLQPKMIILDQFMDGLSGLDSMNIIDPVDPVDPVDPETKVVVTEDEAPLSFLQGFSFF